MKSILFLILLFFIDFACVAQSDVNLVFHIGIGANGNFEIGGTVENNSAEEFIYSAITYITIDKKCNPSEAHVANLGKIKSRDSLNFRIPIKGTLSSYRILNISSWNSIGIPVRTEDKTVEMINKRNEGFIAKCGFQNIQ